MNKSSIAAVVLACTANIAAAQIPRVITAAPTIVAGPLVPSVPYYQVTDLGVLEGQSSSIAVDINDSNVIVGRSGFRSFVYSGCRMTDLGTLGGNETVVEDIHDSGSIVGWSRNAQGQRRPFLRTGGVMTDIGDGRVGVASAIGNWNIPAGSVASSDAHPEAFPFDAAYFINNEAFLMPRVVLTNGVDVVTDMTDTHRVLGYIDIFPQRWGMVSANGFGQWTRITSVPGFEPFVDPNAINSNGYIVGSVSGQGHHTRAFLSTNPSAPAIELGRLPGTLRSDAKDINNANWIVGTSFGTPDDIYTSDPKLAFVRPPGGSLVDLNTRIVDASGWSLEIAMAINESGRIVGYGKKNGATRAFMLTPSGTRVFPLPCIVPPITTF